MDIKTKLDRYAQTTITASKNHLSENQKKALIKLSEAGKIVDLIFLKQVWEGNLELYEKLKAKAQEGTEQKLLFSYFWINRGPWSILDESQPFIDGVPPKPPVANFYPKDLTQKEFNEWVASLSPEQAARAKGFFSVIRRDSENKLYAVDYSVEYKTELEQLSKLLLEAAELVENDSLKDYLIKRAKAFLSNDYFESDVAWLSISSDSPIDVTIGPYETYLDSLFSYKASFECFITLRDFEESTKLEKFTRMLQDIENVLPVPDRFKNPSLQSKIPIVVVNLISVSGDCAGPQTAAFNLPNDEKVTASHGNKLVLLKNVQAAKFDKILKPISEVTIREDQRQYISFESFFTHILAHEVSHSLGPHTISLNGKETTVRAQLNELHSALEEAKADILGLYALSFFISKGVLSSDLEKSFYVTFLAGSFRSIRFGLEEAHGKGQALQLTYLLTKGGFGYDEATETFYVNFDKIGSLVKDLSAEILIAQGEGSREKAKKLFDEFGSLTSEVKKALDKLIHVPIDIAPIFDLEHQ
eukprot:TRINITY_DN10183_c0_g1_i1.p1 TRINITY_DN10183_c0_g1~~TRINITY_DN10183_c0_g1_i1.p1  ORF type:complete len:530 (-),score=92.08 TRINITY_DN10183_c0_g1_i1:24-1613(-)